MVVPQELEPPAQAAPPAECEASCAHHRPVQLSWARLHKRVLATTKLENKLVFAEASLSRSTWSAAHNCGGELKIIAAILQGEPGRKRS